MSQKRRISPPPCCPGIVRIEPAPGDAVVEIAGLPCQDAPSAIRSAPPRR